MDEKKLVLVNINENKRRSTQVNINEEAHKVLKDLNMRTGLTFSVIANKLIKFAADYVVIQDVDENYISEE